MKIPKLFGASLLLMAIWGCQKGADSLVDEHRHLLNEKKSPIILYYSFTSIDCLECAEGGEALNDIFENFNIIGVIPFKDEPLIGLYRKKYKFPIVLSGGISKIVESPVPPSITGVSGKGKILFSIPYTAGLNECLDNLLYSIHLRIHN